MRSYSCCKCLPNPNIGSEDLHTFVSSENWTILTCDKAEAMESDRIREVERYPDCECWLMIWIWKILAVSTKSGRSSLSPSPTLCRFNTPTSLAHPRSMGLKWAPFVTLFWAASCATASSRSCGSDRQILKGVETPGAPCSQFDHCFPGRLHHHHIRAWRKVGRWTQFYKAAIIASSKIAKSNKFRCGGQSVMYKKQEPGLDVGAWCQPEVVPKCGFFLVDRSSIFSVKLKLSCAQRRVPTLLTVFQVWER